MREGCNQYAPMQSVALLRERIAAKVLELYSACYDPASEITVTSGATEVLFAAITAVVGRNDDISLMTDNRDIRFRTWDLGWRPAPNHIRPELMSKAVESISDWSGFRRITRNSYQERVYQSPATSNLTPEH